MQKQSLIVEQVPDSDLVVELLDTQRTFPIRGGNKPKDQVQDSGDDVFESLQSQEMFITQKEPKLKDQISDSDDLFLSDEEILTIQRDHPKSKDQVSHSTSHPDEDRTPKNKKNRRFLNKQVRKKLFTGKMKDLQERIRVRSSDQISLPQGTQKDGQLELIDKLFAPTQSQRLDTQMFDISGGDQEPVDNDLQDLISSLGADDLEKNQDSYKNANSRQMTATTSSQTEVTFEHMQSQKFFDSCMDCEYLLLTAETLMLLVRIMYDNSRFRNRTLSLDKSSPESVQGSKKKIRDSFSQMRSTPKEMRNSFLKEIRLLKEDLDNKRRITDKDMEDSGFLEDGDEDSSRDCHLELDLKSHPKNQKTKNFGRKKRKFEDIETKEVKREKKDGAEKVRKSQKKKKKKGQKVTIKEESLQDIPVESLPCPHELKGQLKEKNEENLEVRSIKSKSKKIPQSRKQSKAAALCDILSSSEFESNEKAKALKVGLSKKKKKPKKERNFERIKNDEQKVWKNCCNPRNAKVKHERREETRQNVSKFVNKKRK